VERILGFWELTEKKRGLYRFGEFEGASARFIIFFKKKIEILF
jgi:hypothetical protein